MTVKQIQNIGLQKALLKYKFDLLEKKKIEKEEEITHNLSVVSLAVSSCFIVTIMVISKLVGR